MKKKISINHKNLFLFGFIFYLISPLIILQSDYLDDLPGINYWKDNNRLDHYNLKVYIALIFEMFFFYYLGSFLATKFFNPKFSNVKRLGNISSKLLLVITSVFVGYFIYVLRASAFQGNNASFNEDNRLQGILSTFNLLLFYLHFVFEQPKQVKKLLLIVFVINSVFLLGLGGRMYVIIPLVAYYMRSFNEASQKGRSLYLYSVIPIVGAVLASSIAAIRIGEDFDKMLYFIFAEPIFTSYSAFSYINQNSMPLFSVPYSFMVSFLNFIPSLIWPQKAEAMAEMTLNWARFENPLGALSIFVSVFANFGIIGSAFFMTLFGGFFGYLYRAYKNLNINKNVYYCFCAVLPFCFFRDPIGIPIKIFISSYTLIPFFIYLLRTALKKK